MLAERQVAKRITVFDQVRPVLPRKRAEALPDTYLVHPRIGQPRATGEDAGSSFDAPTTRWPDFEPAMPPRPSVIAITRKGGGEIGS